MSTVRSTPGRIAAVVIGIPLLLAAIGQGGLSVVALLTRTSENHSATFQWSGGVIKLHSGDGNVLVQRGSSSTVGVSYTEHYSLKKPTFTGVSSASGLALTGKCPSGLLDQNCSVNYTLRVPSGARLDLQIGDGNVTLDGVTGDVTVDAGDGQIRGTDLRSQSVTTSSGDGSVALRWSLGPKRVDVSMGDGSINLAVPNGSGPYAITPTRGDGSTNITVPVDPNAARSMLLSMGDGSISVH
jgi:hypothetical protein